MTTSWPRLKVLVRVEVDTSSADIRVLGTLSPQNLYALTSIIRRINAICPGIPIVLNLTDAKLGMLVPTDIIGSSFVGTAAGYPMLPHPRLTVLAPTAT